MRISLLPGRQTLTSSILSRTSDNGPGRDDEIRSDCNLLSTSENGRAGVSESTTLVPDQESDSPHAPTDSSSNASSFPPTVISLNQITSYKGGTGSVNMSENASIPNDDGGGFDTTIQMGISIPAAEWRDHIRCFLSPLKFGTRHRDITDFITPGTGKWFLDSHEFQRWVKSTEDSNQVLCCVGDPGVGKTGLACVAFESLQELQNTDNSALGFVYCDHMMQGEQTPTHLIGSLLAQLTNRLSENSPIVEEILMRQREGRHLDLASRLEYIRRIATSGPVTTIRLGADGLDELCTGKERSGFLHALAALSDTPNIQFLFFTRNHSGVPSDVDVSFQNIRSVAYLEITGALTVGDRRLFLQDRLESNEIGSSFDEDLRILVLDRLAPTDSTFLLAALQIYDVLNQETPTKVQAAVAQSTRDLSLTYEKMLSRICSQGIKLLHWVLFATRLLTIEELRFAIAIEAGMVDLKPLRQLPFSSFLDSALGILVVDSDKTVRFAHLTMKDYLSQHFRDANGHLLLAGTCLTFLTFRDLSNESGHARFRSGGDLSPFFEYAAFQWGHHARGAGDNKEMCDMAVKWLLSERMQQVYSIRKEFQEYHWLSSVQSQSPLCEACYFGLRFPVMKLLKLKQDVNALDSNGIGPLYSAVCQNRLAVVQLLFKCWDLDINVQTADGITPLHAASRLGYINIVRLFLNMSQRRVPSFIGSFFHFFLPISWVQTVEVNVQDKDGMTALSSAAKYGYKDIVDLLLQHPNIDINVQDNHGWTALNWAVNGGHADIIHYLLRNKDISIIAVDGKKEGSVHSTVH